MRRVLLALLLTYGPAPVLAQQSTPAVDSPARTLRGVVTASNDAVLPRVRVAAALPATNRVVSAVMTDGNGRFVLPIGEERRSGVPGDRPAADLRVTLTKAGYAAQTVTVSRADLQAPPLRELQVRLARGAAILGRVTDRRGDPAMLTRVVARRVFDQADKAPGGAVEYQSDADDLGDYRIGGVPEGRYVVTALASQANGRPGGPAPAAEAATVTVRSGDELANINFTVDAPPAPSPQAPPAPAGDTAAVGGRITNSGGQPVAGVLVRTMRSGAAIRSALTDAEGRYTVSGLSAGEYRVEAIKNGYITMQYGQESAIPAGRTVSVGADRMVDRIDIVLPRGSAVAGTVVDEYGEPLNDVAVDVLQLRSVAGRPRALRLRGRRTDDQGRYRVFGLLPGTYVVRVQVNEALSNSPTEGYPPVYFPGSASVEQATQIRIDLGRDALNSDVLVRPSIAVPVRGVALSSSGKPVTGLVMVTSERSGAIQVEPMMPARPAEDGSFVITNVPPGDYVIQAFAPPEAGPAGDPLSLPEFAAQYVTITDVSPPPVVLRTSRGPTVSGRITIDGGDGVPTSGFSLIAMPTDFDRAPIMGSGSRGFTVQADGTFRYAGLTGPRRLVLNTAPAGWYLKSAIVKGEDVSDRPFDFGLENVTITDVEVVVSMAGATVSGQVTDERATPIGDYTVVVFATDPSKWFPGSRWVKVALPSQDSTFRVLGLPPGDYWTAAVNRVDGTQGGGEWQDAEFLRMLSSRATRVTLGEGQSQTLTLRVIVR